MQKALPILGVAAALLLLWGYNARLAARENTFFTFALQSAGVAVRANAPLKAKELLYAQTLAAQNPLLALPDTNLDTLAASVAQLPDVEQKIYALDASSSQAKLLYSLYPVGFLQALANLEHARQAFIASGSATDEAAYNAAAHAAFAAYQNDAGTFSKAFGAAVPQSSGKFATDGDIVSRADILAGVSTLQKSVQHTAEMFANREQCARSDIGRCNANDLLVPQIPITPAVSVAPAQLAQAKAVRALYAQAHDQSAINQGPMLLLPSTECAANMGGAPLFSFYTPAMSSSTFPVYIGDIRFDTTSATSSASFLKFNSAMRAQISYILDSPMLHYTCLESGHDAGALFAMQDTYAFAQAQNLSKYATNTTTKAALAALEHTNMQVVTQNQAEAYLNAANTLALPAELKSKVTELSLSYLNTNAHFEASLGELVGDEESNAALVKLGWPIEISVPYMFFIRSSFSTLVPGQNLKLFPPNTIPKNMQPFVYYSELPHTEGTVQTLIHDINFYYIIHVDPKLVLGLRKN